MSPSLKMVLGAASARMLFWMVSSVCIFSPHRPRCVIPRISCWRQSLQIIWPHSWRKHQSWVSQSPPQSAFRKKKNFQDFFLILILILLRQFSPFQQVNCEFANSNVKGIYFTLCTQPSNSSSWLSFSRATDFKLVVAGLSNQHSRLHPPVVHLWVVLSFTHSKGQSQFRRCPRFSEGRCRAFRERRPGWAWPNLSKGVSYWPAYLLPGLRGKGWQGLLCSRCHLSWSRPEGLLTWRIIVLYSSFIVSVFFHLSLLSHSTRPEKKRKRKRKRSTKKKK